MNADALIRKRLGVKNDDSLPFKGWRHTTTRNDMLKIFAELGYTKGAEIGVSEGRFSEAMLLEIPNLQLLSVDLWAEHHRWSQEKMDAKYAKAKERLSRYPGCTIVKASSLEASLTVPDESLDFVYVDSDHRFDYAAMDLILWGAKVRVGGAISGHDYYEFYQAGVVSAVRAYTQAHRVTDWYVTWEKEASYFWIRRDNCR